MKRIMVLVVMVLLFSACDAGPDAIPPDPPPIDDCVSQTGATITTCEHFADVERGGRNGDLNDTRWTAFRTGQATDNLQVNNFAVAHRAQVCMDDLEAVDPTYETFGTPPHDFYVCGNNSWSNNFNFAAGPSHAYMGEPFIWTDGEGHNHADNSGHPPSQEGNHWMEAMDDNDQYVAQGIRSNIPFDFTDRTGTLVFDVDAKTEGSHSAWPEIWLTPDPIQLPHDDFPGTHQFPREGVGFQMAPDWCDMPNTISHNNNGPYRLGERGVEGRGGIRFINEYHNFIENPAPSTPHDPQGNGAACVTTMSDMANHFEIKVDTTHAEIWGSDMDGTNFHRLFTKTFDTPLNFTRGYWSFEHAQYAADKFNDMRETTYHWHAIGWDGPVLPADRTAQLDDANVARPDGTYNLGYRTNTPVFNMPHIYSQPTATSAYITFSVYWFTNPSFTVDVILNGHTYTVSDPDTINTPQHDHQWHYIIATVDPADVQDYNTIQINNHGCGSDLCPVVANIDLGLVP